MEIKVPNTKWHAFAQYCSDFDEVRISRIGHSNKTIKTLPWIHRYVKADNPGPDCIWEGHVTLHIHGRGIFTGMTEISFEEAIAHDTRRMVLIIDEWANEVNHRLDSEAIRQATFDNVMRGDLVLYFEAWHICEVDWKRCEKFAKDEIGYDLEEDEELDLSAIEDYTEIPFHFLSRKSFERMDLYSGNQNDVALMETMEAIHSKWERDMGLV